MAKLVKYRKTSFLIPIFNQRVFVFVFDSLSDIRQLYSLDDSVNLNGMHGVVFTHDCGEIVAFESNIRHSIIAHESLHLTKRILQRIGVKNSSLTDTELECYLLGYITDKISVWIEKLENEKS